jgi:hypothetical protein
MLMMSETHSLVLIITKINKLIFHLKKLFGKLLNKSRRIREKNK